jgi:hypothetical protein
VKLSLGLPSAVLVWLGLISADACSIFAAEPFPYQAASYVGGRLTNSPGLTVFPFDRESFSIAVPLTLGRIAFSLDGTTMFAPAVPDPAGQNGRRIVKIELSTLRITTVPGSSMTSTVTALAVSRTGDKIVYRGGWGDVGSRTCGLFDLDIASGRIRAVLETSDCSGVSNRTWVSLSPDDRQVVTSVDGVLQIVSLQDGTTQPIGRGLVHGAWSPDGRWIAAIELGQAGLCKAILIDPSSPSRRRDLGGVEDEPLVWSPDSDYILHSIGGSDCPATNREARSLDRMDVATGKRSIIKSSVCKVIAGSEIGWISSAVAR